MDKLLPCPFCAGEARILGGGTDKDGVLKGYFVECKDCHASTRRFGADNLDQAIDAWNTRPLEDAIEAIYADIVCGANAREIDMEQRW